MVGLRQNLISFLKRATKNANDRPLKHQNSPNFQFFTFSVRSLKKFKFKKWPFLVKIFCHKTQKKVAHQISYGSRSLLNFLRSNQSKKIFPISKVRTFGFQLLSKFMYPPFEKWKIFFVQFEKKWHFWNQLAKPISEMSFFWNQTKKNFKIFPTNTKTGVFDFCQNFKTKGPDLWNGGNFLSPIWPQKIQ